LLLENGDDPAQVIQRIADYRAEDKADPFYYARLTVIKAQISFVSPESKEFGQRESDHHAGQLEKARS
jgi:hypothetical protein